MKTALRLTVIILLLSVCSLSAATRYVSLESTNPKPPYTNWITAATNIQDAVDAALPRDEVVVTNGLYATGGRAVGTNVLVNRVAVDKPLTVRSVSGPEFTVIRGYQVPGTTNGLGAARCVYLADGATLCGFTLTNGATSNGSTYSSDEEGGGVYCESTNAIVSNCVIAGNSASSGGGARGGLLNNCMIMDNSAQMSGGVVNGVLNNCVLARNSAGQAGGAGGATLNNCILTGNRAEGHDGGAFLCTLNSCLLTGNSAGDCGGGADWSTLNNCTVVGNSAYDYGGGVWDCSLTNCIVYYNSALGGENYGSGSWLYYCCTAPMPAQGDGNLAAEPQLASLSHLSAGSPCIGRGGAAFTDRPDLDGEPWATPPSIGCDEYESGSVTGALSVAVMAAYTNVAVGFPLALTALIEGRIAASSWDFADGLVQSNRPFATHAWAAPGDYAVVLRAYNESFPGGTSATQMVHVVTQPVHYVAADSADPVPPYTSWQTAAQSIQVAVDAAVLPGALVLVTDGHYATGGRAVYGTMTNRVAIDKPLTVRSLNGPQFTLIQGTQVPGSINDDGAIRCVYLTNGASLEGFKLTNGATRYNGHQFREQGGGGLYGERFAMASNCVLIGNSANYGGGVFGGTLNNCTISSNSAMFWGGGASRSSLINSALIGNSAMSWGGGASSATLNNCVILGNSAAEGGGVSSGTLNNCTLTGNSADSSGGGAYDGTLNNCTIRGNRAGDGGGASGAVLKNCVLVENSADHCGGGTSWSELKNCTVTGNSASYGGGAFAGLLDNCIVYYNSANCGSNYNSADCLPPWGGAVTYLNYSCTMPVPENWQAGGNITNAPLFVDYAGGNLRLKSNSPCINAGNNSYLTSSAFTNSFDPDGNPRVISGTVDIGAYEYQGSGSTISYAWLQQFGLATDGSMDNADLDGDGHTTWQEWRCQTCPTNSLSALRLLSARPHGSNVVVTWQSEAGVSYSLEHATNLADATPFTLLATDIPGQPGATAYRDTDTTNQVQRFYRVGVR